MEIKDVTGSFEEINYEYEVISHNIGIMPLYQILAKRTQPMEIRITITLMDSNAKYCAFYESKSIHSFKSKITSELSQDERDFLIKIAITNTNGKFFEKIIESSNGLQIPLLSADKVLELMNKEENGIQWN